MHIETWLSALATFTGMAARRVPGIEISALCHYVACRMRTVSSDSAEPQCDWLLLKELVAQMTVRGRPGRSMFAGRAEACSMQLAYGMHGSHSTQHSSGVAR